MKKTILCFVGVFAFAICAILCTQFGFAQKVASASSSINYGKSYLIAQNIDNPVGVAPSSTNNDVEFVFHSENQLASYLEIKIKNADVAVQITRVVVNKYQELGYDDTNTQIRNNATASYFFKTRGFYVVTLTTATEQTTGYYCTQQFESVVDVSNLKTTNSANVYSNIEIDGKGQQNIAVATGSSTNVTLDIDGTYNEDLFACSLTSTQFSANGNCTLNVDGKSFDIQVFVTVPQIVFNKKGTIENIDDVLKDQNLEGATTNGYLFFNTEVEPAMDPSNNTTFNEYFVIENIELHPNEYTARLIINSSSSQILVSYKNYKICTNPLTYFDLHMGSSDGALYTSSDDNLDIIYTTVGAFYPRSLLADYTAVRRDEINKLVVWLQRPSNENQVIDFAFSIPKQTYEQTDNELKLSFDNENKVVELSRTNSDTKVPVDLLIQTNNKIYKIEDVLNGKSKVKFSISNVGTYNIYALYRDVIFTEHFRDWYHSELSNVNINSNSKIELMQGSNNLCNNQITNNAVTVSSGEQFDVFKDGQKLGTYSSPTQFSETGYYQVTNEHNQVCFSIIAQTLATHTVAAYDNVEPIKIMQNSTEFDIQSPYTTLTRAGKYKITCLSTDTIEIEFNGGQKQNIETTSEFTYEVSVQPATLSISLSVKNGGRTSKNVVLKNLGASSGDWTVQINHNGKTTTYTKAQFQSLKTKQRTLTKNGTYTITLTDENGNQCQYSFEKYFKFNAGLIILLVVVASGVAVGLFFILKLRFKSRVR